jgi:hypothetical protein
MSITPKQEKLLKELGYEPVKDKAPQPITPTVVQGRDLFQTPNYAVDLLVPYLPKSVEWVWEPAAGEGKIVKRLENHGLRVIPSDLRGYGDREPVNFLELSYNNYPGELDVFDGQVAIITNPPFSLKKQFYDACRSYGIPFALLIPADYSMWTIKACMDGAEKIVPTRRIDYITPSGKSGATGQSADFHSLWLTWGFNLGKTETFVELSLKGKKENI